MRTIDQAYDYLVAADPECALTRTALRRLVVSGQVRSVMVGRKYLVDLDLLEDFLQNPIIPLPLDDGKGKIRRIAG